FLCLSSTPICTLILIISIFFIVLPLRTSFYTLSLHDALPISGPAPEVDVGWERHVQVPGFFGSSRPSKYFLEKHARNLLRDPWADRSLRGGYRRAASYLLR